MKKLAIGFVCLPIFLFGSIVGSHAAGDWEQDFRRCLVRKQFPGGGVVVSAGNGMLELDIWWSDGATLDDFGEVNLSVQMDHVLLNQLHPLRSDLGMPERLVEREPLDPTRAVRRRQVRLTMGMGGMMGRGGMMGGGMGPGMMMGGGMIRRGMAPGMMAMFGIDGRPYEMERIDQTVRLGDMEVWEVSGDMMTHPFHMHGLHFEVLSRGGSRPSLGDQGLKDTVLVKRPVELLIHFTRPATGAPFIYHCHTLEHEDAGLMGQYKTA